MNRRDIFKMIPAVVAVKSPTEPPIDFKKKFEELQKEIEELKNKKVEVPEPPKIYGGYACSYMDPNFWKIK